LNSAIPAGVCCKPHVFAHEAALVPPVSHVATHWRDLSHAASASHAEICWQQWVAVHASHALGPTGAQPVTEHGVVWPQQAPCTHWPEQHAEGEPQD
jgi:hypothetical protein